MKFKPVFALLLPGVLLVSGCSKNDPESIPSMAASDSSSEISDPMKQPTASSPETMPATSYGFKFNESDIDYSGEQLVVTPKPMGGENPTKVGFVVFVDGIL